MSNGSTDNEDADLPTLDEDRELRKKILSRRKQQRYRKRIVADNDGLRAHARDLERELHRLKAETKQSDLVPHVLPWQQVAKALMEERDSSLETNAFLKAKCRNYRDVIAKLGEWAQTVFGLPTQPRTDINTWRTVRLGTDPMLRGNGIDWITRHLYHNTDAMLERYRFSAIPSRGVYSEDDIDVTDSDGFRCIHRFHGDVAQSVEGIASALRSNIWKFLLVGMLSTMEPETIGGGGGGPADIYRHTLLSTVESVNLVSREFKDAHRTTFVGEQVEDDEALPTDGKRQRRRLLWIVLDELAPMLTKVRVLFMLSHSFTKQGYLPLEDEAKLWGCTLDGVTPTGDSFKYADDATIKAQVFKRHVNQVTQRFRLMGQKRFVSALTPAPDHRPGTPILLTE
ncbi:hypothetical protein H310_08235 [Aphanomyces invadans]|uniref:BZIP domain-containing protein n=1 Tax=Aphanomyces invadans TaxID=157072 RepID=A0A024U024_9STRA|nr:hypothetical protein H310_08235 [Aphanomyces invadans]ETV99579.1 hypothetical protein H310_08235 [Aphanomyces invadans]|eukprot:XP_008872135.1 hypothetical protein H310_08235 [Aphanomyces invadans]